MLNIIFDFLLRRPLHCIIFFDEPDLHLHPELSSKLINTLKTIGEHNQFIFCTHSPDIISSSLEDSVIFIGPDRQDNANQAILVKPEDETHEVLRSLGHSIGIVSLGKRIVLIEGTDSSLDKQTYGQILQNRFSNLVLVPSTGKHTISSFRIIMSEILDKTLWGVYFFMLCDRDAVPLSTDIEKLRTDSNDRLRVLLRYHLENYFLDESILAAVLKEMEQEESWLTSAKLIREEIKNIAKSRVSYATSLIVAKHFREGVGNLDLMPKGCHDKYLEELKSILRSRRDEERTRIERTLDEIEVEALAEQTFTRLTSSIEEDTDLWRSEIPGKQIFTMFCSKARIEQGRLKTLYIKKALSQAENPFTEIVSVFADFAAR